MFTNLLVMCYPLETKPSSIIFILIVIEFFTFFLLCITD